MTSQNKKITALCITILVGAAIAYLQQSSSRSPLQETGKAHSVKLEDHAIYKTYKFGEGPNVIDIGVQPLWLPPGIITEVMSRDRILQKSLAKQGKEVRFHHFLKGSDVNYFIGKGDLEAGVGGDMPALGAVSHHNVTVASMIQQGFCSIVGRKHLQVLDLKGKRVGVPFGSNAHFALMDALAGINLSVEDITTVFMDVNKMPQALENNEVFAYTAWEPTPSISCSIYKEHTVFHKGLSTGYLYFSDSFYTKEPHLAKELIASQIRAMHWMLSNRKRLRLACQWAMVAAAALSKQELPLNEDEFINLANEDLLGRASSGLIPESDLKSGSSLSKEFYFLQSINKIPASLQWKDVSKRFDRTIINEVLDDEVRMEIMKTDYIGDVK